MKIETERLFIAEFTMDMAEAVHLNSLDEDTLLSRCWSAAVSKRYLKDSVNTRDRSKPFANIFTARKKEAHLF